ncbi:MAG: 50S ribosomal protein L3 [Saprospiraceae bacterium]|nr:50S ribosomal protein L3 [Saprospiraceae bacterium]
MNGLIGKKVGMTSMYDEAGRNIACTVIEVNPNIVTQVKTEETDGYDALQVGSVEARPKRTSKAMLGHFDKASTGPKQFLVEFRNSYLEKALGDEVNITDVVAEGDIVAAVGKSKGKGFQGVVKRHGFAGVNDATHGQHNRQRAPGSIGAASDPSKVFKGMRMGGRTGNTRVKIRNLRVMKIFEDKNLILLKGAVPGHKGSTIIIEK